MCKRLTERAADDLVSLARQALRFAHHAERHGGAEFLLAGLGAQVRATLAKHGLLTPADDPEAAAVFMEEEPKTDTYVSIEGDMRVVRSLATGIILRAERLDRYRR